MKKDGYLFFKKVRVLGLRYCLTKEFIVIFFFILLYFGCMLMVLILGRNEAGGEVFMAVPINYHPIGSLVGSAAFQQLAKSL